MEMNDDWEAIDGFNSPGEYRRFCTYFEKQVASAMLSTEPPSRTTGKV